MKKISVKEEVRKLNYANMQKICEHVATVMNIPVSYLLDARTANDFKARHIAMTICLHTMNMNHDDIASFFEATRDGLYYADRAVNAALNDKSLATGFYNYTVEKIFKKIRLK